MDSSIMLFLCFGIALTAASPSEPGSGSSSETDAVFEAIRNGNIERIQELINSNIVNKIDKDEKTALFLAAEIGNERIADLLIKSGADVNAVNKEGDAPLNYAVLNDDEAVTSLLIENGADVNKANLEGNTPIFFASLNSNLGIVELLLNKGANITLLNNEEENPLHWAAISTNEKITDLLIKKGVNVNQANDLKQTALHNAAYNSNDKVAELLIKNGANVTAVDQDESEPFFYTILNGNEWAKGPFAKRAKESSYSRRTFIEQLLKHWTNPIQSNAGVKIAELLINNGANINRRTSNGMTAYNMAISLGNQNMREFLSSHKAEISRNYTLTLD